MTTVIKLIIIMSCILAIYIYGCGGGSGAADSISSGGAIAGIASLIQDDVTMTKGDISGIVDQRLLASMQCAAGIKEVYIFQGHDTSPDDIDINDPNPVQSATVVYNNVSQQYRYSAHSLSEGSYTLAFTCQAGNDSPEYDDDIKFGGMQNVTITGGKEAISHLFM